MIDPKPPAIVRTSKSEIIAAAKNLNMVFIVEHRKNLVRAVEIGKMLNELRPLCSRGEWEPALLRIGLSRQLASDYRRIALSSAHDISTCESIRDAMKIVEGIPEPVDPDSTPFVDQGSDVQNPQPPATEPPKTGSLSNAPPATQPLPTPQAAQPEILCTGCLRKRRVGQEMPKRCPDCKKAREEAQPPWDPPAGVAGGHPASPAVPGTPARSAPAAPSSPSGGSEPPQMVKCPMCRGKGEVSDKKAASLKFTPPTLEEVRAYCLERKNKVDPEAFMAHYESNGWKVGKVPMRNWRGCIVTWEKNQKTYAKGNKPDVLDGLKDFAARAAKDGTLHKEHGSK